MKSFRQVTCLNIVFPFQIKANGVHAIQPETQLNNDPFEDLSLQLLSASKIQSSVQMSPTVPLNQTKLTKLPSATDNFNISSNINCMPATPLIPVYSKSGEHMRRSPNPFATSQNSTNPFTEKTINAGNPFRTEAQESGMTSSMTTKGPTAYPFPPLKPPSHQKGKTAFYVDTSEDDFSLQSGSSIGNNGKPKGWVTFEEDDFMLKSLDNLTQLKRASSMQVISSSTEQNIFTSDSSIHNYWNKSSDCFHPLPARPPPAPPVPSRSASTKSAVDPFTPLAPKVLSTQDFTER